MANFKIKTPSSADAESLGDQLMLADNINTVVVNADNTIDVTLGRNTDAALDILSGLVTAQPWYIGNALEKPHRW